MELQEMLDKMDINSGLEITGDFNFMGGNKLLLEKMDSIRSIRRNECIQHLMNESIHLLNSPSSDTQTITPGDELYKTWMKESSGQSENDFRAIRHMI